MRCTYLGWAGLQLESEGETLVVDPLGDPGAMFAAAGPAAADARLPEVVSAAPAGTALAGLVTHLHRDHADAGALAEALAPGAPVYLPANDAANPAIDVGLMQASAELTAAGLTLTPVHAWETVTVGQFTVTALPAADGTGDPQVSWAIAAGGARVVHCGDTLWHGWWWRAAAVAGPFDAAFVPINGAVLDFPWRRPPSPLPGVMTPEQAVEAARALGAGQAVGMHFDAFDLEPYYRSIADAAERFAAAATARDIRASTLTPGAALTIGT